MKNKLPYFYTGGSMKNKLPYFYSGQVTLGAAVGAIGTLTFQVSSEFNYWMTGFSAKSFCNSVNIIPNFDIQIVSDQDRIFNEFIPIELFASMMTETSTAPDTRYQNGLCNWHRFDVPYKFSKTANIIVNVRNSVAVANTVIFACSGIRVYGES
jgi:hypothetical protein